MLEFLANVMFWGSTTLLGYTFAGYPLMMAWIARRARRTDAKATGDVGTESMTAGRLKPGHQPVGGRPSACPGASLAQETLQAETAVCRTSNAQRSTPNAQYSTEKAELPVSVSDSPPNPPPSALHLPPAALIPHPSVTVVVVAHNEEKRIRARVLNLLASDFTADRLSVLVVSDGSTDRTVAEARTQDPRVTVIVLPERQGKAAGLNQALAAAAGEIVVFTDARQQFRTDTIARLVAAFDDPAVGAVSGALVVTAGESAVGGGVGAYWRLEKKLREGEAVLDSCIGCTGAVYAIRRCLYEPLPEDTILDDVVIPMRIALTPRHTKRGPRENTQHPTSNVQRSMSKTGVGESQLSAFSFQPSALKHAGYRILFDPEAVAIDPQELHAGREEIRKRRTLAGNFQMLFRYPGWLVPWRNRLWWQLMSHKYLRLGGPAFLAGAFVANVVLAGNLFYTLTLAGQICLYAMGLIGQWGTSGSGGSVSLPLAGPGRSGHIGCRGLPNAVTSQQAGDVVWKGQTRRSRTVDRLLSPVTGFLFLNVQVVRGFADYLRGRSTGGWQKV